MLLQSRLALWPKRDKSETISMFMIQQVAHTNGMMVLRAQQVSLKLRRMDLFPQVKVFGSSPQVLVQLPIHNSIKLKIQQLLFARMILTIVYI